MWESLRSRLHVQYLRRWLGARRIDPGAAIHHSVEVSQAEPWQIQVDRGAWVCRGAWLNVPCSSRPHEPVLWIGSGSSVGRHSVISARNQIWIAKKVLLAPNVLLMDHGHEAGDCDKPIIDQGVTKGGAITVEEGAWIGFGAAIICNRGTLTIGRNAVIGANSVVTRDVAAGEVVAGAPARVIASKPVPVG